MLAMSTDSSMNYKRRNALSSNKANRASCLQGRRQCSSQRMETCGSDRTQWTLGGCIDGSLMMKNFTGAEFVNKAAGFNKPTQLPHNETERRQWQVANKAWWESSPMRYDWREELTSIP